MKAKIIKLSNYDIEKLDELLVFAMEEMMSLNNQNKYSNPPIFTIEENNHLKDMMDFTCSLLKQIRRS
ncbi:MAG: hypothetical protein J6K85_04255 [Clostridia bacterium]|nr:hypothetical protein [Clostridia bacterium]